MSTNPSALRDSLGKVLDDSIRSIWGEIIPGDLHAEVTGSDDLRYGDLSSQIALQLAGIAKESPRSIAGKILENAGKDLPGISRVSIDGPGFINMTLSMEHLAGVAAEMAQNGLDPLLPDTGAGRRALVEFVSSNPTGPLTVGHCRQAVLGDAIASLLEATGWKVDREYYFNDGGRQMNLLGESLAARYMGLGDQDIPDGGYLGTYVLDWANRLRTDRGESLQWPDDRDIFVGFAEEKAMEMIRSDLRLLGITFDRFFPESDLIPEAVEETIGRLAEITGESGSLVYSDAQEPRKLWLRLTDLGRPMDRVIRRDDGSYTYRMPDIAYHVDKFRRGYDLMVDVFGSDHLDTSRDVVAALEALLGGEVRDRLKVVLHQFVTLLRNGERVKMSTRAGDYITLAELVRDAGSPDVTRYLFLTRRSEAHMDFDIDLARKQSSENPVYYVQYAHARISGILRTADEAGLGSMAGIGRRTAEILDGEHERELMRLLETVPVKVASAAAALEPHRLTELLAELATGFHRFYQNVRVVENAHPRTSSARLMLCRACAACIRDVLRILGVSSPERM